MIGWTQILLAFIELLKKLLQTLFASWADSDEKKLYGTPAKMILALQKAWGRGPAQICAALREPRFTTAETQKLPILWLDGLLRSIDTTRLGAKPRNIAEAEMQEKALVLVQWLQGGPPRSHQRNTQYSDGADARYMEMSCSRDDYPMGENVRIAGKVRMGFARLSVHAPSNAEIIQAWGRPWPAEEPWWCVQISMLSPEAQVLSLRDSLAPAFVGGRPSTPYSDYMLSVGVQRYPTEGVRESQPPYYAFLQGLSKWIRL